MFVVTTAEYGTDWQITIQPMPYSLIFGFTATVYDGRGYAMTTLWGWTYNSALKRAHRWIDRREGVT